MQQCGDGKFELKSEKNKSTVFTVKILLAININ